MARTTQKTPLLLSEWVFIRPLPSTGHDADHIENTSSSTFYIAACEFLTMPRNGSTCHSTSVSRIIHTASTVRAMLNNELERMWKEATVARFKISSLHLTGGTERNYDKPLRTVGGPEGIRSYRLLNASRQRCHWSWLAQCLCLWSVLKVWDTTLQPYTNTSKLISIFVFSEADGIIIFLTELQCILDLTD
jgi:hypothetical protein